MTELTKSGLEEFVSVLEEKEIEQGLSDEENAYLLLGYLSLDDKLSAKHLWKRLPTSKKQEQLFVSLHAVYKCLWTETYNEFFKTVKQHWPENIKPYIDYLTRRVRRSNLLVLSNFSSLPLEKFCNRLGLLPEEGVQYVNELGWKYEENSVYPSLMMEEEDYVSKEFSPTCRIATSMEKNFRNDRIWKTKESPFNRNATYNTPPATEDPDDVSYSFYGPDDSSSSLNSNRFKTLN